MHAQVGDLCFTPDGMAKKGLLVRHLVMPGLEGEGAKIMKWLADKVSKDCFVDIMEQYHPDAHVGKPNRRGDTSDRAGDNPAETWYAQINRPVTMDEVSAVRKAAEAAGLCRFGDPPKHGGFDIWVDPGAKYTASTPNCRDRVVLLFLSHGDVNKWTP